MAADFALEDEVGSIDDVQRFAGGGTATGSGTTQTGGSPTGGGTTTTGGAGTTATGGAAVTVSTDPYEGIQEIEKSNGGEYHRFAISVGVPDSLAGHFKMAFDEEEYGLMKDPATQRMVLKDPVQGK